ncbi:hypothetical protein MKX03_004565, partial [Papaver bracteatum]
CCVDTWVTLLHVPNWMDAYGNDYVFHVSTHLLNVYNSNVAILEFHDFSLVPRSDCLHLEPYGLVLRRRKRFLVIVIRVCFSIRFAPNG